MPFPTERISLNNREAAVGLSGLNRIVNEFATLQFSSRRAPDITNPWLKHKLQPRILAPGIYESILSLRNRLAAVAGEKRGKFRLTAIEYAILAFAVRVARRHCQAGTTTSLERKLEIYRKRAKRKAIARLGHPAYESAAQSWLYSSRWIRFNLLPLPSARPRSGKLSLRREQYNLLVRLAKEALTERCTQLPSDDLLSKFVKLAISETRRRRHPGVKVRELAANPAEGRRFLFDFIKKRMEERGLELHIKFEYQPRCVQSAVRAERFKASQVVQRTAPAVQPDTLTKPTTVIPPEDVRPDACNAPDPAITKPAFTAQSVADWLIKYLEPDYWEDVISEAQRQLSRRKTKFVLSTATSIDAVQHACRPATKGCDVLEEINLSVDWLLDWAMALESNRPRIHQIINDGLRLAKSSRKAVETGGAAMNGFLYVEELMKGNPNP